MPEIISISLNKKLLNDISQIEKDMGFSGRSEVIRAGVRMLIADKREKSRLRGVIDAVLLILHEENTEAVSALRHEYEDIIKTQMHTHLENHKCLDILVLKGDAKQIKKIAESFQSNRKIELAKLIVP